MSIKIIKPGIYTTIQNVGGRKGYQSFGVSPCGAMDNFAATVCNYLVGNNAKLPVLETHFPAMECEFNTTAIIAIGGANFFAEINNQPIALYQPIIVNIGDILSFKKNIVGVRAYIAIGGGIKANKWLQSESTDLMAAMGGMNGRLIQKNDAIEINNIALQRENKKIKITPSLINSMYDNKKEIRCIAGVEWDWLSAEGKKTFLNTTFIITHQANRMGYQLAGEKLDVINEQSLISSPVCFGTVQLLPSGQIIILMADHQTTGGYPRLATIASVDLPKLAQLPSNSAITFTIISSGEAEEKLFSLNKALTIIEKACKKLYEKN